MNVKVIWGLAAAILLASIPTWAQDEQKEGPDYNASTETTIDGEVVEAGGGIKELLGMDGLARVTVRTDRETLPVVLAPQNYLESQNVKIEQGDQVKVTGSRILIDDKPTIIAREVRKDGNVLMLRSKEGEPAWTDPKASQTPEAGGSQEEGESEESGGAMGEEQGGTGGSATEEGAQGCPTPMSTASPEETPSPEQTASPETTPEETPSPEQTASPETTPEETPSPQQTASPETTPEETPSPEQTASPETTPEETPSPESTPSSGMSGEEE